MDVYVNHYLQNAVVLRNIAAPARVHTREEQAYGALISTAPSPIMPHENTTHISHSLRLEVGHNQPQENVYT